MIITAVIISFLVIILSYLISHKTAYPVELGISGDSGERESQFECGIEPQEEELGKETRERIYIKFYIIAIIFLIFDIESLLLYPCTLIFYNLLTTSGVGDLYLNKSFLIFLIFMGILIMGLVYEFYKNKELKFLTS